VARPPPTHLLAQEEVFGPTDAVLSDRDVDDLVAIANGGLTVILFTGWGVSRHGC